MPNGLELYNKIKRIDSKVRFCLITPQDIDQSALKQEFPLLEVECLISKTVAISDLIKRLETELLR
jgi:hypothetical protein